MQEETDNMDRLHFTLFRFIFLHHLLKYEIMARLSFMMIWLLQLLVINEDV